MIENRNLEYWKNKIISYDKKLKEKFNTCQTRTEQSSFVLDGLRNFAESVMCYIAKYYENKEYLNRYEEIEKAKKYCKSNSKFNFLISFVENLNASLGHDDVNSEYVDRLCIKYIKYLISIKNLFAHEFNLKILECINKYPFDLDDSFEKYYKVIAESIIKLNKNYNKDSDNYYIQKKKPIYVNDVLFYEYVLTHAMDNNTKSDRLIVFSLIDINTKYAIKAELVSKPIYIFNKGIEYEILIDYSISIRPCEIEKLSKIVGLPTRYTSKSGDYYRLMDYLKKYDTNLTNIVRYDEKEFLNILNEIFPKKTILEEIIIKCHNIVNSNVTGKNTLLYLLYGLNNNILRNQLAYNHKFELKEICLDKGVYSFEKSPFSSSLIRHNPSFKDLIEVFKYDEHIPEIIARKVNDLSNDSACIYVPKNDLNIKCDIDKNIAKYNSQFSFKFQERQIKEIGNYIYLNENENNTIELLKLLKEKSNNKSFKSYNSYVKAKITQLNLIIDDKDKESALIKTFSNGSLFAVYGPAGTGKSYFANYLLAVLNEFQAVCIANTYPAVENMKRKFKCISAKYLTVKKYLKEYHDRDLELLVVDECSTISTRDMLNAIKSTNPKLILLLGDVSQIESIDFGNWFALLNKYLSKDKYVELKNQYRSQSNILLNLWNEVRDLKSDIQEVLDTNEISHDFSDDFFEKKYEDEVVLCLNYDGLYGINNLNKVLQANNPHHLVKWKQFKFKIGDPILFNDSTKYKSIFYNNLKGKILDINETDQELIFKLKVFTILSSIKCEEFGVNFISNGEDFTIISLIVNKYDENSYDNDKELADFIPFQIAYAVSIHKAQGLEYDSVKILISNEVEEKITHNIFYTAITRARHQLNIYWSSETENKVIESFKKKNYNNDFVLLKSKLS